MRMTTGESMALEIQFDLMVELLPRLKLGSWYKGLKTKQKRFRWRLRGTVHPRLSVRGWEYEVRDSRVLEADVARCHWWIQLAVTRSVETEFLAIVFNDALTSKVALSCEPTVSSLNDYEINFRISFDESDDEDYTVIYDKNLFSYKIISVDDLKTASENDNDKVKMPSFLSPEPTVSYFYDLDFFKDFENEFSAIVYNDALTSNLDFLTKPTVSPQHIDEFNLKDEISFSECDEEEQNILYFNDLYPFDVIYLDDSKSDKDNDDDKIDIKQSSWGNVRYTDVGAYAQRSNKLFETSHDRINLLCQMFLYDTTTLLVGSIELTVQTDSVSTKTHLKNASSRAGLLVVPQQTTLATSPEYKDKTLDQELQVQLVDQFQANKDVYLRLRRLKTRYSISTSFALRKGVYRVNVDSFIKVTHNTARDYPGQSLDSTSKSLGVKSTSSDYLTYYSGKMGTPVEQTLKALRPPMLEKGNYIPWESQFRRFLDNKLEDGEIMWNSIQNGPYQRPMVVDPIHPTIPMLEPLSKMTKGNKKQYIADVRVMNYLL
ncbi:hypothetical protein Tco_0691070 [Tanacetum coccineum]